MANDDAPNTLFIIYTVLIVFALIAYVVWLYSGETKDYSTAIVLVVLFGICNTLAVGLMYYDYRLVSFVFFMMGLSFMITNHILTQMKTKTDETIGGVTQTELSINETGVAAIILGYVAVGIGLISYIFYFRGDTKITGTSGSQKLNLDI